MGKWKYILRCVIGAAIGGTLMYKLKKTSSPEKYSPEWIKGLTDSEWEEEREIVRQGMCNPKLGIAVQTQFQKILHWFDKAKSDRTWAGKMPTAPTVYREHGWHIYKDD